MLDRPLPDHTYVIGGAPVAGLTVGEPLLIISATPEHTVKSATVIAGGLVTVNVIELLSVPHSLVMRTFIVCVPALNT